MMASGHIYVKQKSAYVIRRTINADAGGSAKI